jgi:hypothetical protein
MRRGGVEPACFMVGSTRKTLGTIEAPSRDQTPSDRFLRLRRDRTQERRDLPLCTPLQVPRSGRGRETELDAVKYQGS